jgi:hypothetical protein
MSKNLTEMIIIETLQNALSLIQKGWVQGTPAVNAKGRFCWPWNYASAWCAGGAVCAVTLDDDLRAETMRRLAQSAGVGDITAWNDRRGRTQQDVIAVFRKAMGEGQNHG